MTLETRMQDGWAYRVPGVKDAIERFRSEGVPCDQGHTFRRGTSSTAVDPIRDDVRTYKTAAFVADVQRLVREATAEPRGDYGDYDEMVEERDDILDLILGGCSGPGDFGEIDGALEELFSWADNYDVWIG